jgi:serine/threonine protein kinase
MYYKLQEIVKKKGYTFHEEIGRGSYGVVYRVSKEESNYATKLFYCSLDNANRVYSNILELHVANLPYRDNQLKYYDSYLSCNKLYSYGYTIAEYYNSDLHKYLKDSHKMTSEQRIALVKNLLIPSLRALHAYHSQGIIHCDIKPDNILFDGQTVKLCDFGLSILTNPDSHYRKELKNCFSTFVDKYRPPEYFENKYDVYNDKVDIWCLGAVLFYSLCGQHVYSDKFRYANKVERELLYMKKSTINVLLMLNSLNFPIDDSVTQVLQLMLTVDPNARPNAQQLLTYLRDDYILHNSIVYLTISVSDDTYYQEVCSLLQENHRFFDCPLYVWVVSLDIIFRYLLQTNKQLNPLALIINAWCIACEQIQQATYRRLHYLWKSYNCVTMKCKHIMLKSINYQYAGIGIWRLNCDLYMRGIANYLNMLHCQTLPIIYERYYH